MHEYLGNITVRMPRGPIGRRGLFCKAGLFCDSIVSVILSNAFFKVYDIQLIRHSNEEMYFNEKIVKVEPLNTDQLVL